MQQCTFSWSAIFLTCCGLLVACSDPVPSATHETTSPAQESQVVEAAAESASLELTRFPDATIANDCKLTARDYLRLGCTPSDPDSCIDPETGQPYCGSVTWLNDMHERDPRFSESLDILTEPEIIGGKDVPDFAYLETVLITPGEDMSKPLCSGALVHPEVVLTAKHCVKDGVAIVGATVRFGTSFDKAVHLAKVSSVSVPGNDMPTSDIAILWLDGAVPASIQPATLASRSDVAEAVTPYNLSIARLATNEDAAAARAARIVGFGLTEKMTYGTKLYADVAVVTANCDSWFTDRRTGKELTDVEFYGCHEGQELVAGAVRPSGAFSVDSCKGDSGGPLFVVAASSARSGQTYRSGIKPDPNPSVAAYRLAGLTSRAVQTAYIPAGRLACGNGGVYERLSGANLGWIETEMAARDFTLKKAE